MFEYLEMSMWKDGTEHCTAYERFALDDREIWNGTAYMLENNHRNNTWKIDLWNTNTCVKTVARGKEETLCLKEFLDWLNAHGIKDGYMDFLRENKWYCEKYPLAMGIKEVKNKWT